MEPIVSVVIATYNYSSVLKYALQSVLWQTFQDFEVWVVGDGCTDDSEAVVASFNDPRIHWYNLPENSGSQSMPNNAGIERAMGKYVAYLGHDDLWYPTHLQQLVDAMEREAADVGHTLLMITREQNPTRMLYGLTPQGQYERFTQIPPSSVMHRRDIVSDIGWWKDYRLLRMPPDIEFISRAALSGKRFVTVPDVTVIKFPSAMRKNVYRDKPSHEQAEYAQRIQSEPDFRYRELLALVRDPVIVQQSFEIKYRTSVQIKPGQLVARYREIRGLEAQPMIETKLAEELTNLIVLNPQEDITPPEDRDTLYSKFVLPTNGVLLGEGWHEVEQNRAGKLFRWVSSEAQLLLTNLDGKPKLLSMDVMPGYANGWKPVKVLLVAPDGSIQDSAHIDRKKTLKFEIMSASAETSIYMLRVVNSRNQARGADPRILNFAVSNIRLDAVPDGVKLSNSGSAQIPARFKFSFPVIVRW